jgi:ankyrin repeat protein
VFTRTVTDLVSRGCNPNAGDGKGWTASHFAAQYGHTSVLLAMQKLYGADLDIDAEDTSGWSVDCHLCVGERPLNVAVVFCVRV